MKEAPRAYTTDEMDDKKTFRCNKCGIVEPEQTVLSTNEIAFKTQCPKCGKLLWEVLAFAETNGATLFTSTDWMYKPREGRPVGPDTTVMRVILNPLSGSESKGFLKDIMKLRKQGGVVFECV